MSKILIIFELEFHKYHKDHTEKPNRFNIPSSHVSETNIIHYFSGILPKSLILIIIL